jgi:uncharacterized protein (DUF1697 family)
MSEYLYVALLRGINVGGNKIIRMRDLRSCFEDAGFTEVLTYIQSGNVLFRASEKERIHLTDKIGLILSGRFGYSTTIVVVSHQQLEKIIKEAPHGFGNEPGIYRYDVVFLKYPLRGEEALKTFTLREGVDKAWAGKDVIYFQKLISRASQSYLSRIISLPLYQNMTIRNWNTSTRLLELMEKSY